MVNSRSGSAGSAPTPTIDAVRRRARHRLIGASVLVAVGVIGFPLLFDTQPRPIPVDIPIEIPSRNTPSPAAKAPVAAPAVAPASGGKLPMITEEADAPKAAAPKAEAAKTEAPKVEAPKAEAPKPEAVKAEAPKPEPAAPAPSPARPAPAEAARAEALLKGQADPKAASATANASARLVVQVGAYAEDDRVRDVRQKLEKAGLKTYVHTATLPEGKRTRVRVGPFDNRAEAEKAAARIKALGLPAAVLTL